LRQIETALVLIHPYERLYQAVQFLFDAVRAAATDEPEAVLSDERGSLLFSKKGPGSQLLGRCGYRIPEKPWIWRNPRMTQPV
jgi:hypothetical protein